MTNCYFSTFADDRCSGRIDPCHLVAQRIIKREHQLANPRRPPAWHEPNGLTGTDLKELLADPRNIRLSCRHHHSQADTGWLTYEIPDSAHTFASEYGLERFLPDPVAHPLPKRSRL